MPRSLWVSPMKVDVMTILFSPRSGECCNRWCRDTQRSVTAAAVDATEEVSWLAPTQSGFRRRFRHPLQRIVRRRSRLLHSKIRCRDLDAASGARGTAAADIGYGRRARSGTTCQSRNRTRELCRSRSPNRSRDRTGAANRRRISIWTHCSRQAHLAGSSMIITLCARHFRQSGGGALSADH